jgi:hypothetical protein
MLCGRFNTEFAEVAKKREEKFGTTVSSPKDGVIGKATSIKNGSTGYV